MLSYVNSFKTKFYKYQAIGNDYIVIDPNNCETQLNSKTIKAICDRNYGVGSDGILYGPLLDEDKTLCLKIYNPDGSEAEKSGNGIRIFAKYLFDNGYLSDDHFSLKTKGGIVHVSRMNKQASEIEVDMGMPVFDAELIPVANSKGKVLDKSVDINGTFIKINCVSMGNPHCVVFTDNISKEQACQLGPMIESHELFPNKTNVQFVKVVDNHNIQIEIWERGAGYTLASGSSSCSAVSVGIAKGLIQSPVAVNMPGGNLKISTTVDGSLLMKGSVNFVAYGYINPDITN